MNRYEVLVRLGAIRAAVRGGGRRVLVTVYARSREEAATKACRLFAHAEAEYVSIPMFPVTEGTDALTR